MKLTLGIVAALLFSGRLLLAQTGAVDVKISLNQEQYLPSEDLNVAVEITNLSGQTLHLGQDHSWLRFQIVDHDDQPVAQVSHVPIVGEFSLDSSLKGTKRANLAPHFNFRKIGRYKIKAVVSIPQWNVTLTSQPKSFDIMNGTTMRAIRFGVPLPEGVTGRPPEVRQFLIQQATYLKDGLFLYVRLTDEGGQRTRKVLRAGQLTSFSKPETQIDSASNLHLLFQTGARAFLYTVISPEGDVLRRETHDITHNRPTLKEDADGKMVVAGGGRRPHITDFPPPPEPPKSEN